MWGQAETALREALDGLELDYVPSPGEAAFYGPKLDVQVKSALGRDETISTVQLDFLLPKRFELEYVGEDGQRHTPVLIHRGVISTMERMTAFLIENYGGAFPLWLAPIQAVLVPVADRHNAYADEIAASLRAHDLRVEVDTRRERVPRKIRDAELQKVPYILVVGDRDVEARTASIRERSAGDLGPRPLEAVAELLLQRRRERT
jgi:threonyl-tRNA synthetase